jgi:hypothetical protein
MSRLLAPVLLAIAVGLAVSTPARALTLQILEHEETASVETSVSASGQAGFEAETHAGPAPAEAHVFVQIDDAEARARSRLTPRTPTSEVPLGGELYGFANGSGRADDAFTLASSETLTRIVFRPESDALVQIVGRLFVGGIGAIDGVALIEVASLDLASDPLLVSFEAGLHEAVPFVETFSLLAGERYELLVVARGGADVLGRGYSGIDTYALWRLQEIPEPATLAALGAGLAVLARRRR